MLKVVIDTNVLVSSFFGGLPRKIIDLWKEGAIVLCLSQSIFEEYLATLNRLGLKDQDEIKRLTRLFAEGYNAVFTSQTPDIRVVNDDPDDDKFIACAVALESKIIVSGDNHLQQVKKYIDIEIMSPREFMDMIK